MPSAQRQSAADAQWLFEQTESAPFQALAHDVAQSVETEHGRIEMRRCWTLSGSELDYLVQKQQWKGLRWWRVSGLRQIALSLLGQDKSTKGGIKAKRKKAGWDNAYLVKTLAH